MELEDPDAVIAAELRAAGVEFESLEVRTAEYYEHHDPETFLNWLSPDNSRYSHFEALRRLGADVHPEVRAEPPPPGYIVEVPGGDGVVLYQVKLDGHEGDVRDYELRNAQAIRIQLRPALNTDYIGEITWLLLGGLYTTFGDDLVFECVDV